MLDRPVISDDEYDRLYAELLRLESAHQELSLHSAMELDRRRMTDRVIRPLRHPGVHILAHPTAGSSIAASRTTSTSMRC